MGKTYFTSDFHFNHKNIIRYANRPFSSVEMMNEEMVLRYNQIVGNDDTVYVLGDVAFGRDLSNAKSLNCRKILLAGNHDRLPYAAYREAGFELAQDGNKRARTLNVDRYILIHSPCTVMRTVFPSMSDMPDGYRALDESGRLPLITDKYLCGHVHGIFKKMGTFINVSVDVWDFRPVSVEELEALFGEGRAEEG